MSEATANGGGAASRARHVVELPPHLELARSGLGMVVMTRDRAAAYGGLVEERMALDLVAVPAFSDGQEVRLLRSDDIERWGVKAPELRRIAWEGLSSTPTPSVRTDSGPGYPVLIFEGSVFTPAHAIAQMRTRPGAILALPYAHLAMVLEPGTLKGRDDLARFAMAVHVFWADSDRSLRISPTLYETGEHGNLEMVPVLMKGEDFRVFPRPDSFPDDPAVDDLRWRLLRPDGMTLQDAIDHLNDESDTLNAAVDANGVDLRDTSNLSVDVAAELAQRFLSLADTCARVARRALLLGPHHADAARVAAGLFANAARARARATAIDEELVLSGHELLEWYAEAYLGGLRSGEVNATISLKLVQLPDERQDRWTSALKALYAESTGMTPWATENHRVALAEVRAHAPADTLALESWDAFGKESASYSKLWWAEEEGLLGMVDALVSGPAAQESFDKAALYYERYAFVEREPATDAERELDVQAPLRDLDWKTTPATWFLAMLQTALARGFEFPEGLMTVDRIELRALENAVHEAAAGEGREKELLRPLDALGQMLRQNSVTLGGPVDEDPSDETPKEMYVLPAEGLVTWARSVEMGGTRVSADASGDVTGLRNAWVYRGPRGEMLLARPVAVVTDSVKRHHWDLEPQDASAAFSYRIGCDGTVYESGPRAEAFTESTAHLGGFAPVRAARWCRKCRLHHWPKQHQSPGVYQVGQDDQ